ncbi:GNAT family N-acetyltransferase [Rummeliibacillus sp. POC4]|uniref:GNAT family N-acetyltransferase n=1 Tax=Rummeliibacillus sp. POC4 TaxID=2305899 RepID=UPI000E6606C2|nr:GNAT family N-acetyltransferase [Rummeliibacillus sp. POC4]RIJ63721.1 GNAT family N-acetyltransferase [Rummeliibacillus sp. POC4]
MLNYHLVSDYRNNKIYRESFFELAKSVFDIDFTKWYEKGCWNDNYICYSYVDNDRIIANASISKMTIVLKGKEYKAIQIGTVMTHPDYRNQGLSKKLMNYIIEQYEKEYDFIYLFANDTVLDFYPKFGFQRVKESHFILNMSALRKQKVKMSTLRQLDINNQYDFNLLESFAAERIPVSSVLGVKNNEHLLMFYFILVFSDAIFYIEEEDTIVICKQEGAHLHVFDMISKKRVDIETMLSGIISKDTEAVHLYFTPEDNSNVETEVIKDGDDTLFVRPLLKDSAKHFLFPITSHA